MRITKLVGISIGLVFVSFAQAGTIRCMEVERVASKSSEYYHLTVYGRLADPSSPEGIDIKDPAELAKITTLQSQSEVDLKSIKPDRYWIWFADASNPDKVEGSVSLIDFHCGDVGFQPKIVQPQVKGTQDAVTDLKTLLQSKPAASDIDVLIEK